MTSIYLPQPVVLTSYVRGGGYGAKAWVARILGLDPANEFARQFLAKKYHLSGSGRSGSIGFEIHRPGIYQFGKLQPPASETSIGNLRNGFFQIDATGDRKDLTRAELRAFFDTGQ